MCPKIRTQYDCLNIKCCTVCLEIHACLLRVISKKVWLSSSIFVPKPLKNLCSPIPRFMCHFTIVQPAQNSYSTTQYLLYLPPWFLCNKLVLEFVPLPENLPLFSSSTSLSHSLSKCTWRMPKGGAPQSLIRLKEGMWRVSWSKGWDLILSLLDQWWWFNDF